MISKQDLKKFQQLDINEQHINFLPVSQKSKNRLYLCWKNTKGIQCKMIGPETKCFCNHKFKDHQYLNPKEKNVSCKTSKCKCKCFDYIPSHGAYDFKCLCKHSFKQHQILGKKCVKNGCKDCIGFRSAWTCSCGSKYAQHQTLIETYEQRKAKGKNLGDMERLNQQLKSGLEKGSLYYDSKNQ